MNIKQKHNLAYVIWICSVAALGGLLQGYDTSVISGVVEPLTHHFSLSPSQTGWAVSSIVIGCVFGSYLAGTLSDKYGRKIALMITVLVTLLSVLGMSLSTSFTLFIIFRIIGGFGIGLASVVSPIYMAEVAPKDYRGRVVTINMICLVGGQVLVLLVNYLIVKNSADQQWIVTTGWRIMLGFGIIPCVLFIFLAGFIPESPRWNVMKGRDAAALKTLTKISNAEHAQSVMAEIKHSFASSKNKVTGPKTTLKDIFSSRNNSLFIILVIALACFNQFTGINVIQYYGPTLLMNITGDMAEAMYFVTWLAGLQFIGVLVGMSMVDRFGRRILLLVGSVGTCICLGLTFLTFYFGVRGFASIIGLLGFMFIFGLSWAQIAWTVASEILPNHLRGIGMGICYAAMYASNFVISQIFPVLNENPVLREHFNGGFPLLLFSFSCLLSWWFVYRCIPETKGVALEDVEQLILKHDYESKKEVITNAAVK